MHSAQNLKIGTFSPGLPIHLKGENAKIELGSHMTTWIVFKLELLVAAGLYV